MSAPHRGPRSPIRRHMLAMVLGAGLLAAATSPVAAAAPDPVLLVHGFQGSPNNFSDLQPWLQAQGRTVVALTLPSQDNKVNAAYSGWPDRLFVVGLDGKIAYKGGSGPGGFKPPEVEEWLKKNVK